MKLADLLKEVPHQLVGSDAIEIAGMEYDSRAVKPGDLFFCIEGFSVDGHTFAEAAKQAGAVCLVVSRQLPIEGITQVIVKDGREAMAQISAAFYGYPARQLRMVGITGTNGKTSTTYMLKSIFEEEGSKVGLIGTIVNMIGQRRIHTERTTPESMDLQKLLRQMLDEGVDTVVMEVSSHSLVLKRVFGILFEAAVFTNLTQDHLDFHGDFAHYAAAKSILFQNSKNTAVNADDPYAAQMKEAAAGETLCFGLTENAEVQAQDIELTTKGCRFVLQAKGIRMPILLHIPGKFSVYNALGAISACLMLGVSPAHIREGLENVSCVPGRFESLDTRGGGYSVILDYCHTPDSLESTLKTVRGFAKGRVVCVFGCGGNRDNTKRPIMGEIAGRMADFSIVTSDNPRFEDPNAIISEILAGMKEFQDKYITIENRREAIRYALKHAQKDDVIVLAGKGHEDYQEIRGVKHDFDEKKVVSELLDEIAGEHTQLSE